MFDSLLEAVKREVSGERALESVRSISRFHRVQASPGLDQATEWVAEALERAGVATELERIPADGRTRLLGQLMPQGWACERAVAWLLAGPERRRLCDYESEPLSLVLRSAPARGRFSLIDVGDGLEDADYDGRDVSGRVVLARGDVHRVHELAVVARSAAGILTDTRRLVPPVRERHDETSALNYTSFWWDEDEKRGWGFVVTPAEGDALRERLARGVALELEVEIESRAFDTTVPLLSGVIPGPSAHETVVISHLCHPRPSANDNASGAAANLETARVLAALARRGTLQPRRSMRFLWVPELTGTYAWFAQDRARADRIAAALNLDMVGEDQAQCGSTFLLEHPPAFAASFAEALLARIRAQAPDWVSSYSGPGHYSLTRMAEVPFGGGSDHAVFVDPGIGVPCPMVIQWPDRFYHSSHDTPDKTDPASLALATRCAATYAGFLACAGAAEHAWVAELVARTARRRLLDASIDGRPSRIAVERLRGRQALASLERLGVAHDRVTAAQRELDAFAAREGCASEESHEPLVSSDTRRPRRLIAAPLGFPRRLMPSWSTLPAEVREAWRRRDRDLPDAYVVSEVAWAACDGARHLAEIERLVRMETGVSAPEYLTEFFELTARLGLSEWVATEEAAWSPSGHGTAGR